MWAWVLTGLVGAAIGGVIARAGQRKAARQARAVAVVEDDIARIIPEIVTPWDRIALREELEASAGDLESLRDLRRIATEVWLAQRG